MRFDNYAGSEFKKLPVIIVSHSINIINFQIKSKSLVVGWLSVGTPYKGSRVRIWGARKFSKKTFSGINKTAGSSMKLLPALIVPSVIFVFFIPDGLVDGGLHDLR